MKKIYYLLIPIWTLLCWSCSSGDDEGLDPTPNPSEKVQVTISGTSQVMEQAGGTSTVTIVSTAPWTATVSAASRTSSWCTVSPANGGAGTHTLTITTTANDTYDERNATVTVTAGTVAKTFTVTQKQKDALTATSAKNEFPAEGGELVIEVKANISYEASVDDDCKSWITSASSRALTTSTLKYTVAENESSEKREGKITIVSGDFKEEIKVYQEGSKPTIVLTQDEYTVGSEGDTLQVELKSNVEYQVKMPDVAWLSKVSSRAMSSHTHYFTVDANPEYDMRQAIIIFTNEQEGIADTVSVMQVQKDALIVAQNEYTMTNEGGKLDFTVNTNVDFEVSTNVDWIRQQAASRGLVEKPLSFTIDANVQYESREGVISIVAGDLKQEIVVKQEAPSVPFVIKQKEYILPENGSRFVVDIYYVKPYQILEKSLGLGDSDFIIREEGHDQMVFFAFGAEHGTQKEIIISNEDKSVQDTIRIIHEDTDEQLHGGGGNSIGASGWILPYVGGVVSYDVHTNLEKYDVLIFGNTDTHKAKYLRREQTDFGYREYFEVPANNTDEDLEYSFAYVGPNVTYMTGATIKEQLFIYFEEKDDIYISADGETFTTHAWTEDDNLNIRLEGEDTSWLSVLETEDTYEEGVRRINTTFVASPNITGKTREIYVVAYNGFNDTGKVRVIQPSGESVLYSNANLFVGAWKDSYELILKDCEYTIEASASWLSLGEARKESGKIVVPLEVENYDGETERDASITIKSGDVTNTVSVKQLPESGALIDDSDAKWKAFQLPKVNFETPYPNTRGSMLYHAIVQDPTELIAIQSRRVLDLLYFSPDEPLIPRRKEIIYRLDNFDGVSYFWGGGASDGSGIALSNEYVDQYYTAHGAKALVAENKGVLSHELTHSFQLSPQGVGDYNTSKVFHACIEGMADAVRVLSGGFPNESDRPKGGSYLDSYRYTGFFIAWLVKNKDKDFLRKFNLSTQHVIPWSFDGAIKYALGDQYNVDDLWTEYQKAMGDIK